MENDKQTPEQLLQMILDADDEARLRICRLAIDASDAASKCFMAGHEIEIDNLKRTIIDLSAALLASVDGESVDPVMVQSARNAVHEELSTSRSSAM